MRPAHARLGGWVGGWLRGEVRWVSCRVLGMRGVLCRAVMSYISRAILLSPVRPILSHLFCHGCQSQQVNKEVGLLQRARSQLQVWGAGGRKGNPLCGAVRCRLLYPSTYAVIDLAIQHNAMRCPFAGSVTAWKYN